MRASVAFISMPFHLSIMPPIGLGILKSALSAAGLSSTIYNFNLDLLPELGETAKQALLVENFLDERMLYHQIGEWIFALPDASRDEHYLSLLPEEGFAPEHVSLICRLRSRVGDFLPVWARRVVAGGHDIVGFSCSLGRTRANVRMAEAIRTLAPAMRFLFGGFAASGDMGRALLEAFPVVDLVCHTEADDLIVPIVSALRHEQNASLEGLQGISYRQGGGLVSQLGEAELPDIDRTPLPDYSDYFEQVALLGSSWDKHHELPLWIPIELARGCWWGAHQHCLFCSNNGERMVFRFKSPERALSDIDTLYERHHVKRFLVVDNIIANDYYRTLLARLGESRKDYQFRWEVRPNLSQTKAAALARAGVLWVQPGIESLSTEALGVMNKQLTAIDNIQTMKWLLAYDLECIWNHLFSLPGEQIEWYEQVARIIPRLMHLPPPTGARRINVRRYSPYFNRSSELGVKVLGPTAFAGLAFSELSHDLLSRLIAEFDHEIEDRPRDLDARILDVLAPPIALWRERFEAKGCTLSIIDGPDEALLIEGPLLNPDRMVKVQGLLRCFLKGCESKQSERQLLERLATDQALGTDGMPPLGQRAYREVVEQLNFRGVQPQEGPSVTLANVLEIAETRGWIYREAGRILALPVNQTWFVQSGPFQLEAAYRRCQAPATNS